MRTRQTYRRIWFIGDSLTAGYDASSRQKSYSQIVSGFFAEHYPGSAIEVLNHNIYGGKIRDGIRQALASSSFAPDLVILQLGENDHPYSSAYIQQYRQLLDVLTGTGSRPLLCFLGVWNPSGGDNGKLLTEDIRLLAGESGGLFVDLSTASGDPANRLAGRDVSWLNDPAHQVSDTFHPNDDGHFAIAQAVIWKLQPYIRRGVRRHISQPRPRRLFTLHRTY